MSLVKIQSYGGTDKNGKAWYEASCQHCEWFAATGSRGQFEEEIHQHCIYHLTKEMVDVIGPESDFADGLIASLRMQGYSV